MIMFDSGKKNTLFLIGCTVCTIWGCERQVYLLECFRTKTRNCGRLLISQGSCCPTDLCKVFGDEVMCITIKMLCLVKRHFACSGYF